MLLNELFEMNLADVPPTMRRKLSMKDIEAMRPKGAYSFRVIPSKPDYDIKYFMNQDAAENFAQRTGGRIEKI
jgi:hypothetical protein